MKYRKILLKTGIVIVIIVVLVLTGICGNYFYGKSCLSRNVVPYPVDVENINFNGKNYRYRDGLINILCMGIDKEEQMALRNDVGNSVGQADAIFLVSIDVEKKEIRALAIPRDTMVTLQMYDDAGSYIGSGMGQITLQYAYGDGMEKSAQLMVSQVSQLLYNIPINGYAAINVRSLWSLNDAIGGVDMYMEEDYTLLNPAFEKGKVVHLTAKLLENYIRERDSDMPGTAYTRIHRLKQYMLAYFAKAKIALKEDVMLPFRALKALEKDMETDIVAGELMYLVTKVLGCSFSESNLYTLPGTQMQGTEYEEFYLEGIKAEELIVNLFYEESDGKSESGITGK